MHTSASQLGLSPGLAHEACCAELVNLDLRIFRYLPILNINTTSQNVVENRTPRVQRAPTRGSTTGASAEDF